MKKVITIAIFSSIFGVSFSQDFDKNLASARSAYSAGKLSDTRFALEQILSNLDVVIGKEILKLLPTAVGSMNYNQKDDNVTGSTAGVAAGLYVHRTYGLSPKSSSVDIINNSPMIASVNAILNTPVLGGMMQNENQKIIKVQGYKCILQKNLNSETQKTAYDLQVPLNNTLLTFRVEDSNESEVTQFANTIPLAKIAQIAQ